MAAQRNAGIQFGICGMGLLLAVGAQACTIKIAYNVVPRPPYYVGEGEAIPHDPGVTIELIDLAAASIGCSVNWRRMPPRRILRDLDLNAIDATLALSYSTERAAQGVYPMKHGVPDSSLAVWTLAYDFYVKAGSGLQWDGKRFNRKPGKIGANAAYSVVKDLAAAGITAEEAPGDQNNLEKLMKGRIDAYAGQDWVVDSLRERTEFKDIEKLVPSFVRKEYFLVFSKAYYAQSAETANSLWRQIAAFKSSRGRELDAKYKIQAQ